MGQIWVVFRRSSTAARKGTFRRSHGTSKNQPRRRPGLPCNPRTSDVLCRNPGKTSSVLLRPTRLCCRRSTLGSSVLRCCGAWWLDRHRRRCRDGSHGGGWGSTVSRRLLFFLDFLLIGEFSVTLIGFIFTVFRRGLLRDVDRIAVPSFRGRWWSSSAAISLLIRICFL